MDAEQYYGELEEKLTDEFNAERSRIALKRLDMAFVTFQDERMTAMWVFLVQGQPKPLLSEAKKLMDGRWNLYSTLKLAISFCHSWD